MGRVPVAGRGRVVGVERRVTTEDDLTFDPFGSLPDGRVAIEASAGTGKTFALASLATRFLAERDVAPSDLLIVTFTRAATAELRSRIRDQMTEAVRAMSDDSVERSALVVHLASQDAGERLDRLRRAVADFDAASISTIHGFATQVRRTLGLSATIDADARLSAGSDVLIRAACTDALAAAAVGGDAWSEFPSLEVLVAAATKKLGGPDLVLAPDGSDTRVQRRFLLARELVEDAVERFHSRRTIDGSIGFDDVLIQLRDGLHSTAAGAVVEAIRSRYKVVLIDEFQDTDHVQWDIFSSLFGTPGSGSTLVLVGDPKQAIYRFRGADVSVYLEALHGESTTRRFTLTTNWRADAACLAGLWSLFEGATFGDPSVRYVPVRAATDNGSRTMAGPSGSTRSGLHVRVVVGGDHGEQSGKLTVGDAADIVERDVAAHVRELLEGSEIPTSRDDPRRRPVRPSDVAVLVTAWHQAYSLQSALAREGIPAVVAGAGSVLESEAATQVRYLLDAMERPGDLRRVRTFAASWFGDLDVGQISRAGDTELAVLQEQLSEWSIRLADRPVAEVLAEIWKQTGVVARVLGRPDGDRNVTDLDHVAELLHGCASQGRAGVAGLLGALHAPPEQDTDADTDADLTARRIESEAQTVLITTVWRAKGLEFPVVCVPMLWRQPPSRKALVFTEARERVLDVTCNGAWPDNASLTRRKALAAREEAAERLRVLYVALTRARHHTAVWWTDAATTTNALSRLLFARDPSGSIVADQLDPTGTTPPKLVIPKDPVAALGRVAQDSDGTFTVARVPRRTPPAERWLGSSDDESPDRLEHAPFPRMLDRTVSRWSFSTITRFASEEAADPYDLTGSDGGAGDELGGQDLEEPGPRAPSVPRSGGAGDAGVPAFGRLQAGTAFGTFIHGVLETVDFADTDVESSLRTSIDALARKSGVDLATLAKDGTDGVALLVEGLAAALRTPLGPLFDGTTLSMLDRSDRLDEVAFDLRLGGGGGGLSPRDIGTSVVRHLPERHPLSPWAAGLASGSIDVQLAGYLTGSIDLVARVHHQGAERFVVVDYKTNRLTGRGMTQTADDYGHDVMAEAMAEHHYPLQALLYAVALHRYLRWKRPTTIGPTPVHGAAYLFVRGMTGPEVSQSRGEPHGVFTWEMAPELILEVSDLLDGRHPGRTGR